MSISKFGKSAAAMFLASAILVGCGGGEERQAEYLSRAQEFYDSENYEKAKIEVKNVLQINPNNTEARYLAGLIEEKNENYRDAYAHYYNAVQADSKHIKSLNKLAEFTLAGGSLEDAHEYVSAALSADPKNAESLALLAMVYMKQEETEKATLKAQEALSIDPGNIKATGILTAIYAKDNPDLAIEVISKGIANQSKNESLKALKLRLLIAENKREEAEALFKELIAEYPEKLFYTIQLVNYYIADESRDEAERQAIVEKMLEDLVEKHPDEAEPREWLVEFVLKNKGAEPAKALLKQYLAEAPQLGKLRDLLASLYIQAKDYPSAEALYQSVIDEESTSASAISARTKLAQIALARGDVDEMNRLLGEVFELDAENSDALLMRAGQSLKKNDVDAAIPDLRIVLKNDPESQRALILLAKSYEFSGSDDLALDSYQRLLGVKADSIPGLLGAAKLLVKKEQAKEALPLVESAVRIDPSLPEAVQLLTDLYSRDKRWDDALSASAQLIENESTKALGLYLQGRVYLRKKDYEKAIDLFKSSLEVEPSGIETLKGIAGSYVAINETDKAIAFVSSHLKSYPGHAHAQELLAGLYAAKGELARAITLMEKVIDDNPKRIGAYPTLAKLYVKEGEVEKAEKLYLNAISENENNPLLKVSVAELYQLMGEEQKAIQQYEEVLASNPDALVVKNNLASLLLDTSGDPEAIKRAAELSSELAATENPAFLDTAGWAQYKLGNYAQAVSLLAAALESGGSGPVFHYHLGMAYFKSDMKAQAEEQLLMALEDENAVFVGKEEAQKVLESL